MNVTVNGESRALEAGATVANVIALLELASEARGVAVALDGEVVRRGDWTRTELHDGASLEVLQAIGGG